MKVIKEEMFLEIKKFVESCGSKLLSSEYVDSKGKLKFVCVFCGRDGEATYTQIRASHANCNKCRYDRSSQALSSNYEDVKSFYEFHECKLISKEYKNSKTILEFICKCGNSDKKSYDKFKEHPQCRVCSVKPISEYYDLFINYGCEILDYKEYKGRETIVSFLCKCGNKETKKIKNFIKHPRCIKCANKSRAISNSFTFEEIKEFIENNSDCKLQSTDYINYYGDLKLLCKCGEEFTTNFGYFKHENKRHCDECGRKMHFGENHYNWRGGVCSENILARSTSEYHKWREDVYKKDNYSCQKCGDNKGGNLQAHHIYNFSDYKGLRLELENGITLCSLHHDFRYKDSFHAIYGTKNNTIEQLEEYLGRELTEARNLLNIYNNISNNSFHFVGQTQQIMI